jgi:D-glycero-alpha-D-manno-heptose 1-phosphate guanylyltransferase
MERLSSEGVGRFVLSLGYLAHQVIDVARVLSGVFRVEWVVEPTPLGTGGAALFAMHHAGLREALVANADTLIEGDLSALLSPLHPARGERARMGVVQSAGGARFGGVVMKGAKVQRFLPRGTRSRGLINAGIYRLHRSAFARFRPGNAFSLEADVLEELARQGGVGAAVVDGAFADIGVTEDYLRFCAQFTACR